ncbi:trypsin-like serine protease [Amphritea sp. HPY]|uniref:trypsin-like serine protease n=1 Tax=Amphritea sp. HPY TaxID=3421652 RepID=UPI003D7E7423
MKKFTSDEIQKALDEITEAHNQNNGFIAVEYTEEKFVVRYRDMHYLIASAPNDIEVYSSKDNILHKVPITYESGPEIIPAFGNIEEHPPYEQANMLVGEMGGDQCRNSNSMGSYGTITLYAKSITLEASGRCNLTCSAAPALMSNNHVIGRSDAGRKGEVIWTPFRADTARLECLIPFSCRSDTDVALARVHNTAGISNWTVRTIGRLNNLRRPNIGESIKKHGARTGYTTGRVTGQTNIRVGAYTYRRVFSTTGGFSCPGDSGSAVVASNNDLIGVLSWGDSIPCDNSPRGYFWTLVNPGRLSEDPDFSDLEIAISNS